MVAPAVHEDIAKLRKAKIEECLREGYAPFRTGGGKGSSVNEAAKRLAIPQSTLQTWVERQIKWAEEKRENYLPDWSLWEAAEVAPKKDTSTRRVRRYLLTAAQDDTAVHEPFWANLNAFARHLGAEIMVGGFTYQKGLFEDHASRSAVFAELVRPHLRHERVDLGPIVFCAEMNILPTAVRPLSGLEAYTGQKWGVFPHAKIQLVSVATFIGAPAKQIMTTGACTVANYVAKKAGLKAEFHHVIGATLVEIDDQDRVWCRQINATEDGAFQDLDALVRGGKVTTGHRSEAITWGDIHREKLDPLVALHGWGVDVETDAVITHDTMIDTLRPRYQFIHDLLDFEYRNHHRRDDHHFRFQMICRGTDRVEDAVISCSRFLRASEREFCRSVVNYSNHDGALLRWLKDADYRQDVANAPFFLRCQAAVYEAIEHGDGRFNVFRWALEQADPRALDGIDFVDDDQSFVICQAAGGIECGMHGHLGVDGGRGSAASFVKTAVKMNVAHRHSPGILDGVYHAGLSGLMDQGYNKGLSSWAQTHILTYPSGKRTLITMQDGRWRA